MANTVAVPEGLAGLSMSNANRHFALALTEAAEAMRDVGQAAVMPVGQQMVQKLGGAVIRLEQATNRIRHQLLNLDLPAAEPPRPLPQAPVTAGEAELERENSRLRGWLEHISEQAGATFIEDMAYDALYTDEMPPSGLVPKRDMPVTQAMEAAAEHALEQQFRAQPWEEAKDVLEGIDWKAILTAALAKRHTPDTDQETKPE